MSYEEQLSCSHFLCQYFSSSYSLLGFRELNYLDRHDWFFILGFGKTPNLG